MRSSLFRNGTLEGERQRGREGGRERDQLLGGWLGWLAILAWSQVRACLPPLHKGRLALPYKAALPLEQDDVVLSNKLQLG